MGNPVLVEVTRGTVVESRHAGAVAVVDTTTPWMPTPEAAMEDTVYTLRMEGRLAEALAVLERWLAANPDDRPRRLAGRPGALDEAAEVAAPEPAMPAGRVERGELPAVRPLAQRGRGDAARRCGAGREHGRAEDFQVGKHAPLG